MKHITRTWIGALAAAAVLVSTNAYAGHRDPYYLAQDLDAKAIELGILIKTHFTRTYRYPDYAGAANQLQRHTAQVLGMFQAGLPACDIKRVVDCIEREADSLENHLEDVDYRRYCIPRDCYKQTVSVADDVEDCADDLGDALKGLGSRTVCCPTPPPIVEPCPTTIYTEPVYSQPFYSQPFYTNPVRLGLYFGFSKSYRSTPRVHHHGRARTRPYTVAKPHLTVPARTKVVHHHRSDPHSGRHHAHAAPTRTTTRKGHLPRPSSRQHQVVNRQPGHGRQHGVNHRPSPPPQQKKVHARPSRVQQQRGSDRARQQRPSNSRSRNDGVIRQVSGRGRATR